MSDAPRRRVQLVLELGADDWQAAANALWNLAHQLDRGQCRQGCVSGGCDSGYVLKTNEDESVTHDSWYADLQAYLAASSPQPHD